MNERLIWVDLEMSGLEIEKERIIEMAVCVTDSQLTKIAQVRKLKFCNQIGFEVLYCHISFGKTEYHKTGEKQLHISCYFYANIG